MKNRIVVLDLGNSKVAALLAERTDDGGIGAVSHASIPSKALKRGAVADIDELISTLREAVEALGPGATDALDGVVVGIGGPEVSASEAKGLHPIVPKSRLISRDDLLQVLNHSRRQMLPPDREEIQAIPQSYSVDGQRGISRPIGMSASKLEVDTYLVTAPRALLQNVERAVHAAGGKVVQFVPRGLASGLAVLSPEEMEAGTAIIDIGAGVSEIAVFSGGSIAWSTTIPIGSSLVTSDLMKLLKTSPDEAERLKTTYGCAVAALMPPDEQVGVMQLGQIHERPMQRRVLCEIIESRMRELATFVVRSLEANGYALLPGGIVLTGGGAKMPGVCELFQEVASGSRARVVMPVFEGENGGSISLPEWASTAGIAEFVLNVESDDLAPVSQSNGFAGRIKTIWTLLSGKA